MRDALRHKSAPRRKRKIGRGASRKACDAERRTIVVLPFRTLRVGMPCVTLCVTDVCRAANARLDAERPERRTDSERRHDSHLKAYG
ncbi:hypothetical protein ALP98_01245 [Pseudomonas viridiflava]|uniref:DUF1534 domain-containing protein n=1 Tax=Pseudomonas viridiflava TaxID=33069 RepID=A0A3M4NZA4_PSEVI|nr:hypothetical protein ALP98_01245 [Pseudomonas viridiflava]